MRLQDCVSVVFTLVQVPFWQVGVVLVRVRVPELAQALGNAQSVQFE